MITPLYEVSAVSDVSVAVAERIPARRHASSHDTLFPTRLTPRPVPVAGVNRPIEVKIASEMDEWEQAFRLVADSYRARGYEPPDSTGLRFTPYHALPDTTTFVARHAGQVVATLSLVSDNVLLGLPMECIYGEEIQELRKEGRRIVEVTSLADRDLTVREFVPVFVTMSRLMVQWAVQQGADILVITINPRHRLFYRKVLGFVPLGPWRPHPSVQGHPAEAYKLDEALMRANAPPMHEQFFCNPLPADALRGRRMPNHAARYLSKHSCKADSRTIEDILQFVDNYGSPRTWR